MNANGGNITFHFSGNSKDLDSKINGIDKSFGSLTKSILAATGITKLVSAGINLISGSIDGAISRVDTLNNFPRVMQNLGIATKDSQKAIKRLSDGLKGLPTTLNDGAMAVQRFTSKNGDVKKSTDLFLALNNALLAGGASYEIQASALEQISQAYAKGKPDMMEWRSLMTAMPAQLKQVAQAMGYVDADSLGEDLRKGNVSMDEFMNKIVELNTKGTNGLASFQQQAKGSTGGIATSITNMKTSVVRAVGNIITELDKSLQNAGFGGISGVLSSIGKTFEEVLGKVAEKIPSIVKHLTDLYKWFRKNKTAITSITIVLGSLYTSFKVLKTIGTIVSTMQTFSLAINTLKITAMACGTQMSTLSAILKLLNLSFLASPIFWIIAGIIALVAVFVLLWNKCAWFRNFWIGLWEGIKNVVSKAIEGVKKFFTNLISFVKSNWKGILLFIANPFLGAFKLLYDNCEGFRNFVNGFVNAVVGFFKSIPGKLVSFAKGIINVFASIPGQMLNIGKNIAQGLWNGIAGLKDWVISKVKNLGKSILNSIKNVLGIHSPSTEFAMLGKFSVLGYTEQLDRMKRMLQGQIADTFAISPQLANSSALHYSPNVVVQNNITSNTDPLGQVVYNIKTFANGSKPDYNYGMGA